MKIRDLAEFLITNLPRLRVGKVVAKHV